MFKNEDINDGSLHSKLHKISCCASITPSCNFLFTSCRTAVSGNKRRYTTDGYNLDLTYINERIIVHGFPAAGLEHIYRNPRYEIRRFLDEKHMDKYKVFNFCCEPGRGYSPEIFHGRVERYPFKDHNTPPLETMVEFANSAKFWLDLDPQNVCSMHCKAGKGRAGLMACILLLRSGAASSAKEAMDLYDRTRVKDNKGLTVTSQRKYVMFYEALWRDIWKVKGNLKSVPAENPESKSRKYVIPEQPELNLHSVEILGVSDEAILHGLTVKIYKLSNFNPELIFKSNKIIPYVCNCDGTKLKGNFKIVVEAKKGLFGKSKVVELMHNTLFMQR